MKQIIRSSRKGSYGLNEEDRQEIGRLLLKAGYTVKFRYTTVPGTEKTTKPKKEWVVEFWEEE